MFRECVVEKVCRTIYDDSNVPSERTILHVQVKSEFE